MELKRVGFSNFKSIGIEPVWLDLTKKINVIIGPNNSGKSNVLEALGDLCNGVNDYFKIQPIQSHKRQVEHKRRVHLHCDWSVIDGERMDHNVKKPYEETFVSEGGIDNILDGAFKNYRMHELEQILSHVARQHFTSGGRSDAETRKQVCIPIVRKIVSALPKQIKLPAFRQISQADEYQTNGAGVIRALADWITTPLGKEDDLAKYHRIRAFLRTLLNNDDLEIEIPNPYNQILVNNCGLRLPLSSYGTGVHQLIILAVAIVQHDTANTIICLEEPEVHLHPLLQKLFLRFLIQQTLCQFVIATHSPSFLSRPEECCITRLWLESGVTKSEVVSKTNSALALLADLGVSAADIMQSRFVIWVEGPSDIVYLRKWISLATEKDENPIIEGIDYSFVMYGGRCLSHVSMKRQDIDFASAQEHEADSLIEALRINQHSAIVIDSDIKSSRPGTVINETKKRIELECKDSGIMCWITQGREIENYLPSAAICSALNEDNAGVEKIKLGRFDKIESQIKKAMPNNYLSKYDYSKNKPKYAQRIAKHIHLLNIMDLESRIIELVSRIRGNPVKPA